ncbi:MAG: hypothetical protein HY512_00910 [Candidatus Aenigmarchaeota archaeon]|nr:hypothetical protein [Candidatus Aenigmarchaeota archaeon]
MKNKKITLFILMLLAATVFISGCAQQPVAGNETINDVKSDKDVADVVGDVSTDISDFTKDLDNIDSGLG